jgi:ribosome-associated protein
MTKSSTKPLRGKALVAKINNALQDALAEEITVIDLQKLPGAADWFVICQCDTTVHGRACADRVLDDLAENGTRPWQREGLEDGRWILLDYSDVVVHIMLPELRGYYRLEELWEPGGAGAAAAGIEKEETAARPRRSTDGHPFQAQKNRAISRFANVPARKSSR